MRAKQGFGGCVSHDADERVQQLVIAHVSDRTCSLGILQASTSCVGGLARLLAATCISSGLNLV